MVTVTYTSLTNLINALSDNAATAEALIDHAINLLNTYGASVSNLTGDAGSKTGTYTQAQAGAIITLAVAVYSGPYLTSGGTSKSIGLQGVSLSQSSSSSSSGGRGGSLGGLAKELAEELKSCYIYRT